MSMLTTLVGGGQSAAQVQALIDASVAAEATARNAAIAAAVVDPLTTLDLVDDFISGFNTTGNVGSLGWNFVGGTIALQTGEASHPGIIRRDTSATISTTAYTQLRLTVSAGIFLASEFFDETWIFRLTQTDADTRVRIGFSSDWTTDTPVSGIYIEKILTDTQWFGVGRAASTQTRTAALATVDAAVWHNIRIRRIDATTVGFTLDAGAEVTVAANVPNVGVIPGFNIFNGAAASKTIDVDFFRLKITGLVR
jgi:hypothetical protein